MECFFTKLNKYRKHFYYVLVVPRTLKRSFHVLILAITSCRCSERYIPMYSYCIYYCSLPTSLLKAPYYWGGGGRPPQQTHPHTSFLQFGHRYKMNIWVKSMVNIKCLPLHSALTIYLFIQTLKLESTSLTNSEF